MAREQAGADQVRRNRDNRSRARALRSATVSRRPRRLGGGRRGLLLAAHHKLRRAPSPSPCLRRPGPGPSRLLQGYAHERLVHVAMVPPRRRRSCERRGVDDARGSRVCTPIRATRRLARARRRRPSSERGSSESVAIGERQADGLERGVHSNSGHRRRGAPRGRYVVGSSIATARVTVLDRDEGPRSIAPSTAPILPASTDAMRGPRTRLVHLAAHRSTVTVPPEAVFDTNVRWHLERAPGGARGLVLRKAVHLHSVPRPASTTTNPGLSPLYLPVDEDHPLRPSQGVLDSARSWRGDRPELARRGGRWKLPVSGRRGSCFPRRRGE